MDKSININLEPVKQFYYKAVDYIKHFPAYFVALTLDKQIATGVIPVGMIFILVAVIIC